MFLKQAGVDPKDVNFVAQSDADVVKLPLGPAGQFAARLVALPPDMEGFANPAQNPRIMMIYHRFMRVSGHFRLLS